MPTPTFSNFLAQSRRLRIGGKPVFQAYLFGDYTKEGITGSWYWWYVSYVYQNSIYVAKTVKATNNDFKTVLDLSFIPTYRNRFGSCV